MKKYTVNKLYKGVLVDAGRVRLEEGTTAELSDRDASLIEREKPGTLTAVERKTQDRMVKNAKKRNA